MVGKQVLAHSLSEILCPTTMSNFDVGERNTTNRVDCDVPLSFCIVFALPKECHCLILAIVDMQVIFWTIFFINVECVNSISMSSRDHNVIKECTKYREFSLVSRSDFTFVYLVRPKTIGA
jgi:hypothetical protein